MYQIHKCPTSEQQLLGNPSKTYRLTYSPGLLKDDSVIERDFKIPCDFGMPVLQAAQRQVMQ